uniref:Uncharacterized protein n=1 Tax=Rhizophora mucronata TaxID=61149 RepID=A0A2P2IPY0_RHIMU
MLEERTVPQVYSPACE